MRKGYSVPRDFSWIENYKLQYETKKKKDARLIFLAGLSNEAAVIVAKDTYVFLFLIYRSDQLEYFLPQRHMKIDSSQLILNINYGNLPQFVN